MGELKITSWNVNSLRSRLERVEEWLTRHQPDVLCLQETKCADGDFPQAELAELGYQSVFTGQQNGLNGVAILAREEPREVLAVLPGRDEDEQRRFQRGHDKPDGVVDQGVRPPGHEQIA